MLCLLEEGDSFQDIYKKVISKARMWPHLFHTRPQEKQVVASTWILGPGECPLWAWKFFRGRLQGVEEGVQLFGLQRTEYNQLSQAVHCGSHTKVKGIRAAAAWAGVGVASLEPETPV